MSNGIMDFERPLVELEKKIEELRSFTTDKGIDFSDEIKTLEKKASKLKNDIYGNLTPWQKVLIARHPERLTSCDYINKIFGDFIELHGDRYFADDPAVIGGIARFNGVPVTVLGHRKGKNTKENLARNFGMPHPEGYRKSQRLMKQAEKFGRPVVCFIDTPGAYCGVGAEERGESEAIARNLQLMSGLQVPIVAVVIGEGGSGGALALGVGDRVLMLENAVYSISTPETCATILWKDAGRAQEAVEILKLTAQDLLPLGIIDEIIPEPMGGAHKDPEKMIENVTKALEKFFQEVAGTPIEELLTARYIKYRSIGQTVAG